MAIDYVVGPRVNAEDDRCAGAVQGRTMSHMMNIEVMQVLVAERRHDLRHSARAGRIARSLRRSRRHAGEHRAVTA